MIFVTVGNALQEFDRLIQAVEELKASILPDSDIFVQYGNSRVIPNNCASAAFLSREEFDHFIADATLVITHGGEGSIIKCLQSGKKPIVVPRRKALGEHVNDHQFELVRRLEAQGRIFAVYDMSRLSVCVKQAMDQGTSLPPTFGESRVRLLVKDFFNRLAAAKKDQ